MSYKPRVLIVEDVVGSRERMEKLLRHPPAEWCQNTGIGGLNVDTASTAAEARNLLLDGLSENKPYEAVLLDLKLPSNIGDEENEDNGRALLTEIRERSNVAVVVLTGFPAIENLIHAVKHGATDFLTKPLITREDEKMVFIRLISAIGRVRETAYRNMAVEQSLRFKNLQDRDRMLKQIADTANGIPKEIAALLATLQHRYGLDPIRDKGDAIIQKLEQIRSSADAMRGLSLPPTETCARWLRPGRFGTISIFASVLIRL